MIDIPGYDTFIKIEPVIKGWSGDKKYYIETSGGRRLLLRVADITQYGRKKTEYEMMKKVAALGVPMQRPVDFGTCHDGKSVYVLLIWVDGEDMETVLPLMSETDQYVLGLKSGEILRKIHSLPAPAEYEDWETRFNLKTDRRIETYHRYKEQVLTSKGEEHFLAYVESNRALLKNRPQCYQHGDYHPGNMITAPDGSFSVIDWNRDDFGDPWEEFNRITFTAHTSPHFATGQFHGYFGGEPPAEFFKLLAFYIASNQLGVVGWARPFGQSEADFAKKQNEEVLRWYDNMRTVVPSWYIKDFYIQRTDGGTTL
jgi:serine/threonine-protein kinase